MAGEAGGKLTKTAVGRLAVAELRTECRRLGLPEDGLKAALVERLMSWWEEQGRQRLQDQKRINSAAADAEHAAPAASAEAVASVSADCEQQAEPQRQAAQEQQAPRAQQAQQQGTASAASGGPVSVTWLGTSSGNPTPRRNVSSIAGRHFAGRLVATRAALRPI